MSTRPEPNSAYLWAIVLANRGVELVTTRAGVPVERAVGLAALRALVDVAADGGDAVGGLVLLGQRTFAGELDRADRDRRAVGVELLQGLPGGDDARLVESVLDDLLGVGHGGGVRDLDLDGERGLGAGDDGSGHGWASLGVEANHYQRRP
jgi:hypothetical protein